MKKPFVVVAHRSGCSRREVLAHIAADSTTNNAYIFCKSRAKMATTTQKKHDSITFLLSCLFLQTLYPRLLILFAKAFGGHPTEEVLLGECGVPAQVSAALVEHQFHLVATLLQHLGSPLGALDWDNGVVYAVE